MNWDACFEELKKIAEVNLLGVSPESALEQSQPMAPMETSGLSTALRVLKHYPPQQPVEPEKTAAKKKRKHDPLRNTPPGLGLPAFNKLNPETEQKGKWGKFKGVAGRSIAGAGAGRLLADFHPTGASPKRKFVGMAAGGAVGLGDYAYSKLKDRKELKKTATITSPAMGLRSSQQVAKFSKTVKMGPSIKSQTPLIGRKGSLPQ